MAVDEVAVVAVPSSRDSGGVGNFVLATPMVGLMESAIASMH